MDKETIFRSLTNLRYFTPQALVLLAGPCVVEGREITLRTAETLLKITESLEFPLVFKSSYRKANRSRLD